MYKVSVCLTCSSYINVTYDHASNRAGIDTAAEKDTDGYIGA
jgi:hypothetical protein